MASTTLSTYARKDCERIRDIATKLVPEGRYFEHGIRSCVEGLLFYELVMAIMFKSADLDGARKEKINGTYIRAFMDVCGQKSVGCAAVMLDRGDDRVASTAELAIAGAQWLGGTTQAERGSDISNLLFLFRMSAKQYAPQLIRARFGGDDTVLNDYMADVFERSAPYKTEPRKGIASHSNSDSPIPEIGKQVKWRSVLSVAFRVLDFDRNGTQILPSGKVKPRSLFKPYGYLLVDGPMLTQPTSLPIVHKDDFKLIASVFDDREYMGAIEEAHMELLTTYQPEKTKRDGRLASIWHCLHYALVPEGTLDAYYSNRRRFSHPELSLLFGPFVYQGEVKVHVNQHPQV